ncbi:hypothetical protein M231_04831 [Tremella mesenterica]|uniref:Uncharacterized protein n=1 Tax=Tremella mesenterica TaxID=5217 RepID=A0A4Q1BJF1_TREME|nr:hypothetical protein M231_04831 [Tremella mesenterica]
MPIAPIVGRLRKHIIADISIALGLGASAGYLFWYGVHIPQSDDYIQGDHRWPALPEVSKEGAADAYVPKEVAIIQSKAINNLRDKRADAFFDHFILLCNYFQHPDRHKGKHLFRHLDRRHDDDQLVHPPHQVIYKFNPPSDRLSHSDYRWLMLVIHYASMIDDLFRVPGTHFRFGFGFFLNLVPEVGDVIETLFNFIIWIYVPWHTGCWRMIYGKVLRIEFHNFIICLIPFLGAYLSAQVRPNRRNSRLLSCFMSVRSAMAKDVRRGDVWVSKAESMDATPLTLADYLGVDEISYGKHIRRVFMGRGDRYSRS